MGILNDSGISNIEALTAEILAEVQMRLQVEGELPAAARECIGCYIREIINRLCHYLHICSIPKMLLPVIAAMTCEMIRIDGAFVPEGNGEELQKASGAQLESIKLGDASFSFSAKGSISQETFENVIRAYKQDLHAYRRMRW